jgi:hypothetical protein
MTKKKRQNETLDERHSPGSERTMEGGRTSSVFNTSKGKLETVAVACTSGVCHRRTRPGRSVESSTVVGFGDAALSGPAGGEGGLAGDVAGVFDVAVG